MAVRMKAWFAKGCCMAMGVACICSAGSAGDGGKVWSLAAAKDGRVAVMVANFGDTDVPFGLDLGCVPSECILTDETRTAEKVAVPEVLPRHSFLLVQGRR